MVWEQNVYTIVMLTQCVERGKADMPSANYLLSYALVMGQRHQLPFEQHLHDLNVTAPTEFQ
mgnify:FL=1